MGGEGVGNGADFSRIGRHGRLRECGAH
jgi:hypothetical protein